MSIGWTLHEQPAAKPNLMLLPLAGITGAGLAVEGVDAPEAETEPVVHEGGHGVLSAALALVPLKAVTKTSSAQSEVALRPNRARTANSLLADTGEGLIIEVAGFIIRGA